MKRQSVYPFTNDRPPGFTIHKLRADKEWSLEKLGRETGLSVAQLSRIENGNAGWTRASLEKIASAFSLPTECLFWPPFLLAFRNLDPEDQYTLAQMLKVLTQKKTPDQAGKEMTVAAIATVATK